MASLRSLFLLIVFTAAPVCSANSSLLDYKTIHTAALQSLLANQTARAGYWAHAIDMHDTQAGFVYRLAWLQTQTQSLNRARLNFQNTPDVDVTGQWKWKWNGELWADEISSWSLAQGSQSSAPVSYSTLPKDMVRDLVLQQLPRYASLKPSIRAIVRDELVYLWSQGDQIDFSVLDPQAESSNPDPAVKCEWEALKFLLSSAPHSQSHVQLSCADAAPPSPLWTAVRIQQGDGYFKKSRPDLALKSYQAAQQRFATSGWNYRMAVTALLSEPSDEYAFRAAYAVLDPEAPEPKSSATERGIVENLVCERVEQVKVQDLLGIFERVFEPRRMVSQTVMLTRPCNEQKVKVLWNILLRRMQAQAKRNAGTGSLDPKARTIQAQVDLLNHWIAKNKKGDDAAADLADHGDLKPDHRKLDASKETTLKLPAVFLTLPKLALDLDLKGDFIALLQAK